MAASAASSARIAVRNHGAGPRPRQMRALCWTHAGPAQAALGCRPWQTAHVDGRSVHPQGGEPHHGDHITHHTT
ncbi:hypothetical protein XcvCFBP7111P_04310 [Xanthomonas citri pv. vignicola]|uniref:Uncharacterized protein n=2 Tax=Xanthomonas citri TaxID=346 RepID=A0AB33C8D7_XANCI|nr:hypothetical protein XcvCFBP7111P_04310 [Xanthomonas citri pv. vignicola]MBZ3923274.1 hypothetical protein [Xanthomonas citri pv. sesbaniae]